MKNWVIGMATAMMCVLSTMTIAADRLCSDASYTAGEIMQQRQENVSLEELFFAF